MKLLKIAGACLNQTPFSWQNNQNNILAAIAEAHEQGVAVLCLPELCITGYGCEDDFFRADLRQRAWSMLEEITYCREARDMVITLGLPVMHRKKIYNCTAVVAGGQIQGLVAKKALANDGLHYEARQFGTWPEGIVDHITLGRRTYPIGDLYFDFSGISLGFEICEEAWTGRRPGSELAARAIDIILNPSASHFAFGKYETRRRLVTEGSRAFGAVYVYTNLLGNEAGRAIYDGGTLIAQGGKILAAGERFSFKGHVLTTCVVDIDINRMSQARTASFKPTLGDDSERCVRPPHQLYMAKSLQAVRLAALERIQKQPGKEEEFALAISLGLFDYLRKSNSKGYMLSLSGGADSSACAALVKLMVEFGVNELGLDGFKTKLGYIPAVGTCADKNELVRTLLVCAYQGTNQSSQVTLQAARELAAALGATFFDFNVQGAIDTYTQLVSQAVGRELSWQNDDIALQNIQARARAPLIWMLANIYGFNLLSTSNRSEGAVGYCTMDGDTAGGLSPLAGIDKNFLRSWLSWLEKTGPQGIGPIPQLHFVTAQQPTAELRPQEMAQTDEKDLMPYDVLNTIEEEAIENNRSPEECFLLISDMKPEVPAATVKEWVAKFFRRWAHNQWKRERLAPALHCDTRNLDPRTWRRSPILSGNYVTELKELDALVDKNTVKQCKPSLVTDNAGTKVQEQNAGKQQ